MNTQLATKQNTDAKVIESVLMQGDLSKLSPEQRLSYYKQTCESLNLNPLTRPFEFITLNGKLTLYVKRDGTDQLRKVHSVSVKIVSRERLDDLLIVTAQASLPSGRVDESVGAVNVKGLNGDNLANAMMKAETKAKRRVTLSICGLGFMDESEVPAHIPQVNLQVPAQIAQVSLEPVSHTQGGNMEKPLSSTSAHVASVSSFKESHDPNDLLVAARELDMKDQARPAKVSEVSHIATLLDAEIVHPGEYVIESGSLKGTKLCSKPKDFWASYEAELSLKIKDGIPKEFLEQANELRNRIQDYLMKD